jgi:hypothetical protein
VTDIPIESIAKLELSDGDTLVLKLKKHPMSHEVRDAIKRTFEDGIRRLYPNVKCLVLEPDMDLEVIKKT